MNWMVVWIFFLNLVVLCLCRTIVFFIIKTGGIKSDETLGLQLLNYCLHDLKRIIKMW